jgi:hypothetical protein
MVMLLSTVAEKLADHINIRGGGERGSYHIMLLQERGYVRGCRGKGDLH